MTIDQTPFRIRFMSIAGLRLAIGLALMMVLSGCSSIVGTGLFSKSLRPFGETREATVPLISISPVTLRGVDGRVRISTHADLSLKIFAEVVVYAPDEEIARQIFDRVGIRVGQEYDTHVIHVGGGGDESADYEIHVHLTVPETTPINVETRSGAMKLEGVLGPSLISSERGAISVSGVHGNLVIATREGDIEIRRVEGSLIKTYVLRGNTTVASSRVERIEVTTGIGSLDFQSLRTTKVSGRTQSGTIHAEDVQGRVELAADQGAIHVSQLSGDRYILKSGRGNVTVANCQGMGWVEASLGTIHLSRVSGEKIEFRSGSGSVIVTSGSGLLAGVSDSGPTEIQAFRGDIDLKSRSGPVSIQGRLDRVKVETGSGAITVVSSGPSEPKLGTPGVLDWELRTSFGPIRMQVPSRLHSELDLYTKLGRVHVELPSDNLFTTHDHSFSGKIGNGTGHVLARSGGGVISVEECPGGDLNPHSQ